MSMDRKSIRNEAEWQGMVSEVQALRRKLHSKTEALLIITKELDATQKERDQYKLMAEKLRVRCQSYKRQFTDFPITKDQASLIQMLRDTRNQKIAHQKQCEVLQQKLTEALGDVKLLREKFARQRIGDEGIGPRHFPAHEREVLVVQLENAKQMVDHYRQEFNIASDQITEITAEKEDMAKKAERLNNELNFMLNGDKKRIIDIDALCMENKYLQERVKQCQDEKNSLHAQMSKLKSLLNTRKARPADIRPGSIRNSGLVFSPKQIKQFLSTTQGVVNSTETMSDLQTIAAALLETVNDKNLALHHLRNTNKILGKRVAELELKLKTLEVAGLWTLSGQRPPRSTPAVSVTPSTPTDEEFFSSLGSRLSQLTDTCDQAFHKLVSLTPEGSSSNDDVTKLTDDVTTGTRHISGSNDDITNLTDDVTTGNFEDGFFSNGDGTKLTDDITTGTRHISSSNNDITNLTDDVTTGNFEDCSFSNGDGTKLTDDITTGTRHISSSNDDVTELADDVTTGNFKDGSFSNCDGTKLTDDVTIGTPDGSNDNNDVTTLTKGDDSITDIGVTGHHGNNGMGSEAGDFAHGGFHSDQVGSDFKKHIDGFVDSGSIDPDPTLVTVNSHCDVTEFESKRHLHDYDTTVTSLQAEAMASNCHTAQAVASSCHSAQVEASDYHSAQAVDCDSAQATASNCNSSQATNPNVNGTGPNAAN